MKPILTILLFLSGSAFAQVAAVTKNPNTNEIIGNLQTSQLPVMLGCDTPDVWSAQQAFTSILSSENGNHGLISRTQNSAGAAIIGLSETGASAGKFIQFNSFNSPTVYMARDAVSFGQAATPTTPTLTVTTPANNTITPVAEFKKNMHDTALRIGSDGSVTAPFQQYTDSNALTTKGYIAANYTTTFTADNKFLTQSDAYDTYIQKNGVTDGTAAALGKIGEYITNTAANSSLVTATAKSIHSLWLTAGEWDVQGVSTYTKAATTVVTYTQQGIGTTNNVLGGTGTFTATAAAISDVIPSAFATPVVRISLTSNAYVYLTVRAGFTTSTLQAAGTLSARRVR